MPPFPVAPLSLPRRLAGAALLAFSAMANAADAPAAEAARPAVGVLLNEAQALIARSEGAGAVARLQAAEALAPLNAYEAFMLQRLRGAAALQTGDLAGAQSAFEQVLAAQRLTPDEQRQTLAALGQTLYRAKDYAAAARWLQRYAEAGGSEAEVLALRAPALYFAKDTAGARALLLQATEADAAAGRTTPLPTWRLLAGIQRQLADEPGYRRSLRAMAMQHPQPALWAERVQRELGDPAAWPERQWLDVQRLLHAAGAIDRTEAVLALAAEAQQAGFPGEALRVLDQALARPGLADAERAALSARRASTQRPAEADRRQRPRDEAAALKARDGQALVALGWAWATEGEPVTGLPLIAQGLQRGGLARAGEARLHQGMALALAGRPAEAQAALQQVQGEPALVALAGLWADFAARRGAP
ncbi:hypothetical protein [Ideonella sp.]|uniref:hypothetical protein n=1 Tax=Ideonella sp. TaxID=1929293 RepID=UPI002B479E35|nr:hypothetical protein [Ideonella sp.]HJV71386.1 hypothetical protein [Ideonella sp.]